MPKKRNNKIPLPILILVCAVLIFAMYSSLSTLGLAIWGDTIMGNVDSYDSRLDNARAGANLSRTVSKGYYFTIGGKKYRGYVIYRSDEAWPRLGEGETRFEEISYFPFCPYINKPAALADFSEMGDMAIIYHILSPLGCLFLLLLVTGGLKRKKKPKKAANKTAVTQNKDLKGDENMFCPNCGNILSEDAAFCSNCGGQVGQDKANTCSVCGFAISEDTAFCPNCGSPAGSEEAYPSYADSTPSPGSGDIPPMNLVGFSNYYNHPEILEAGRKNRRNSIGCMWIAIIVPLIGFPIAGLTMSDFPFGESLIVGISVSLVMLIFGLFALHSAKKPIWDGVVTKKFSKEKHEQRDDSSITYTEYTVAITTDTGKKKKIVEKDSRRFMYDYLNVGDRVRFHPRFGTYEKYDKSNDRIIYCNVCMMMNPIQNDRCKRCNNLLFK